MEKHIDTYKTFDESTFMKPEGGLCKIGGYVLLEIPDDVVPIYNGFIMGSAVTLCDAGHMVNNNGSCVPYAQGNCHTNDSDLAADSSSFMGLNNGACLIGGYQIKEIPDGVYGIFGGFIMGSEVTLCNNGFLVNNGSCSTYTTGECPENYQDLALNDNTMTKLTNGSCASGYQTFTINQQCDENTNDAICAILCSNGLNYTDVGTCAELCPGEHHILRAGTDLSYPMYATKQITPSINLGIGNSVCYVNLVPGRVEGALHIKYNNQTYHAVK